MNTLKLKTTDQDIRDVSLLMNQGRGKQVSMTRQQLLNLVQDHGTMFDALENMGFRMETN